MKKNNLHSLKRVFGYTKKFTPLLVLSSVLSAASVALSLYSPVLIGDAIDLMIVKNVDFAVLSKYLAVIGALTILSAIALFGANAVNNRLAFRVVENIRNDVITKLQKLSLGYLDGRQTGEIVTNMVTDAEIFSDGVLVGFTQIFTGAATIIGTVIFMFMYSKAIAAAVIIISPLSLLVAKYITKKTHEKLKKSAELKGTQAALTEEIVENMKTVKAFGYESSAEKKFDGINTAWRGVNVSAVFFSSLTNPVTRFINAFIYALVALAGGMCAANLWNIGVLTAGGLSCMLNYASKFTRPFNEISGVATELASALVSADRIFALLDEKEEASDQGNIVLDAKGNVKLDDVAFSYTKERELIKNLNLDVKRGQRIAIVGPTGCGKTTLINLLMRFYDVDEGSVSVDGNDVRSVTRKSLRNGYGMVLQESWIKRATVRENLTFCGNASDEEIARVAKKCNIDGFISRLKDGYDTVITDGDLSQGEKQMLCIARVMLAEPKMLILDEATSSVDMRTERDIGAAFDILMEGKTSFIVAHRLSTIKNADMILVMKDGKIIEKGTHKELFDKGGFYRQLYESRVEQNV